MPLAERIADLLGGRPVLRVRIHTLEDFTPLIRSGLPVCAAVSLMEHAGLTQDELIRPLGLSRATFLRKKKTPSSRLEAVSSDRLYRIAHIIARTKEVFGDEEKASRWLHQPNRAMQGEAPYSKLDTEIGFKEVQDALERIEYGDYS